MLSYIELHTQNILHNFRTLKSLVPPETIIMSVVKGNAYGHGLSEVVSVLDDVTDRYGIISVEDLRMLRKQTAKPALLLGYIARSDIEEVVRLDGSLCVYDEERMKLLQVLSQTLNRTPVVHLKIDAALGRQGILPDRLEQFLHDIRKYDRVKIEGMYAHFANIEDTQDFTHAQKQIALFAQCKDVMRRHGYADIIYHISSTAGTYVYEHRAHESSMVRLGIGLYGMYPSPYIEQEMHDEGLALKPVMRWITHVAQIKSVPAGFTIGYGLTYVTPNPMTIAVIPQGYADGFDRGLSNRGTVLIRGVRCKILGRVAMNMFVVDVTHIPHAAVEDEVVLLGAQGNEIISAEEIADLLDTINYEVTTRVSALLPRKIVASL